jgi:hypothetical protein
VGGVRRGDNGGSYGVDADRVGASRHDGEGRVPE